MRNQLSVQKRMRLVRSLNLSELMPGMARSWSILEKRCCCRRAITACATSSLTPRTPASSSAAEVLTFTKVRFSRKNLVTRSNCSSVPLAPRLVMSAKTSFQRSHDRGLSMNTAVVWQRPHTNCTAFRSGLGSAAIADARPKAMPAATSTNNQRPAFTFYWSIGPRRASTAQHWEYLHQTG